MICIEYFIGWYFCSVISLSAESLYQCKRTYTRGNYKMVAAVGFGH